jgi:hypothetical protein
VWLLLLLLLLLLLMPTAGAMADGADRERMEAGWTEVGF